jgi:GT2 family glycosyltransferase
MSERPVDLVVSVGTLGNFAVLERCLESVYAEDLPGLRYEVWVVYNGRTDDGVSDRIARRFPTAVVVRRPGPLGYCLTHNLVMRACHGRYVLILDDDTIVTKGTLATMVEFMDRNPRVGMAGCKTLNADGTFQRSYGVVPSFRSELRNVLVPDSFWPRRLYRDTGHVRDVEWLNGAFMLVRAETIADVGMLDEHYYTYVCEPDWCQRMRRASWRVTYVPDGEIVHVGGEHSINNKRSARSARNLLRYHVNRYYFFRKHYGAWAVTLLRPIMLVGALVRLAYYALIGIARPERREEARVRVRTFWDVIKLSVRPVPYRLPSMPVGAAPSAPGVAASSGAAP